MSSDIVISTGQLSMRFIL